MYLQQQAMRCVVLLVMLAVALARIGATVLFMFVPLKAGIPEPLPTSTGSCGVYLSLSGLVPFPVWPGPVVFAASCSPLELLLLPGSPLELLFLPRGSPFAACSMRRRHPLIVLRWLLALPWLLKERVSTTA